MARLRAAFMLTCSYNSIVVSLDLRIAAILAVCIGAPDIEAAHGIRALGVDVFSKALSISELSEILRNSRRSLKVLLMDKKKIAGLGEHLFQRSAVACAARPAPAYRPRNASRIARSA